MTIVVSQLLIQATSDGPSELVDVSQAVQMAMINFPTENTLVSQVVQQAYITPTVGTDVSDVVVMALVRGSPAMHKIRAWTFTLDGHEFYVLKLGLLTTLVYDQTTKRWCDWRSANLTYWRAHVGMNWENEIVGGDALAGVLWNVTPDFATDGADEGVPFDRICTGGLPMRLRDALVCNAAMLSGSMGRDVATVNVTLRTSDDNGETWHNHGTLSIPREAPEVAWQSLGTIHAPGRIFEIVDDGFTRIDGLDMW
jgi:hypothetical protein